MTTDEARQAIGRLPRVRLAHLPTPLEEAPRFSNALGGVRVFVKRDDCTGLLIGGNKARHNEFLMGDAIAQGCDTVVWGAGVQSNNCRQTAAACAKLGLECRLYLSGAKPPAAQGNLLLDYLVGAKVEFTSAKLGLELDAFLLEKARQARAEGRKPYVWDRPRVLPLAAASYALCTVELAEQLRALGLKAQAVYVSSAGSTGAGLVLGKAMLGESFAAKIISPMTWPWSIPDDLANHANAAAAMMGIDAKMTANDFDVDLGMIGPGYAIPSEAGQEAMDLLARTEAILTDPVYSAKALAGLVRDVRAGMYKPGDAIVFVHTGGVPAIFAEPLASGILASGHP